MPKQGTVLKSTGSWYEILSPEGEKLNARLRGKLKIKGLKSTNPITVGDEVIYDIDPLGEEESVVIKDILARKNYIVRKSIKKSAQAHLIASNVDQAVLVVTVSQPTTSLGFVDRFLVACESFRIPVTLVFNKADLFTEGAIEYCEAVMDMYEELGYPCIVTSVLEKIGLDDLKNVLDKKKTLIAGHSGTGKSSLINSIYSQKDLKIGEISSAHNKGKHTTTFAEMFHLDDNTYVIDSPGIKELGLFDIEKENISHYFPEMRNELNNCKFHNCTHMHEPGCKVKELVENGEITHTRYASYQSMFEGEDYKY